MKRSSRESGKKSRQVKRVTQTDLEELLTLKSKFQNKCEEIKKAISAGATVEEGERFIGYQTHIIVH